MLDSVFVLFYNRALKVAFKQAVKVIGSFYTAAIQSDGSLWTWGDNSNGRLGNGTTESSSLPLKVMEDVVAVCAGENITSALKSDGSLWTWGDEGNYGALGSGGQTNARYPGPNGATYQDVPRKIMENVRLPAPRSAFATSLPSATRYVPYSASLPEGWRTVDGTLPLWLASDWNLLSGLPDKAGEVHLTITDGEARRTVSLTVRENSDSNVRSSTSDGYQILKDMPDIWKSEFRDNAGWLKFSFHSYSEFPDRPYLEASAEEIGRDYDLIQNEIIRFAGEESFIAPLTIHWGNLHPAAAAEIPPSAPGSWAAPAWPTVRKAAIWRRSSSVRFPAKTWRLPPKD